jgi:hypothetical protein
VLKKAGIVVATVSAAALLSVAPLAFADDEEQSNTVNGSTTTVQPSGGLITLNVLNGGILNEGLLNDANVCPNVDAGLVSGLLNVLGGLLGGSNTEQQGTTCVTYNDNVAQLNEG